MDTVEIQLVGGPAHGTLVAIQADPMDPPATYELQQAPPWHDMRGADPTAPVKPRRIVYRRHVNPHGTGPLWLYLHEEQP